MVNKYKQSIKKHYIDLLVTKYVDSLKLEEHQIVHFCDRKPHKKRFPPCCCCCCSCCCSCCCCCCCSPDRQEPISQLPGAIYNFRCSAVQYKALHRTALHCNALNCTELHSTELHSTSLHCILMHSPVQQCICTG